MSNKDAQLSETGEELLAYFAHNAKVNRTSLLSEFVDDAFNAAIKSMPPGEIAELHRRVSKLFLAAFKTPEMDKLVREKVVASANLSAEGHVERLKPQIEAAIEKEIQSPMGVARRTHGPSHARGCAHPRGGAIRVTGEEGGRCVGGRIGQGDPRGAREVMKGYTPKPPETFAKGMARLCRRQKSLAMGEYVMESALLGEHEATLKDVATWLRKEAGAQLTKERAEVMREVAGLLEGDAVNWDNIDCTTREADLTKGVLT